MDSLCRTLMLGGSTAALLAAMAMTAVQAQDANDVEEVVVSASRITIAGYQAPTPVTVVGAAQIERDAKTDIGDSIRELPSVGSSDSPNNGSHSGDAGQGDAGVDTVNLRNLGVLRTLILFDGQRVVASNPLGGGVDLSTIPTTLVQRIDIVTGGASAAWGSDAVAGVVNLVLNKSFEGFKSNVQFADSTKDDHRQYKGELSWGTGFDGDRGHLILSGQYTMSPDAVYVSQRSWFNPVTLFPGPAGGPTYVHQGNIGSAQYTQGGLINSNPAGTAAGSANALKGIQFVGPNGTPAPFSYGNGTILNGNCFNCSGNNYTDIAQIAYVAVPYHNTTLFAYGSYKLSDAVQASVQLNYGENFEENTNPIKGTIVTIKSDNAYLDPGIASRMATLGISSFSLGTSNTNNQDPVHFSILNIASNLGVNYNLNTRQLMRGVFTLEGALGNDWSWNAYVQHSQVREQQHNPKNTLTANYNNAVDAVRVTAANVGTSGLPIGSIQCRSTLTAPTNGCAPLDVLGNGVASQAALDYVAPGRLNSAVSDQVHYHLNQDVAAASMQGTLPWQLPAGRIAVAFGAEYRQEQQRNIGDPLGLGATASWGAANYTSFAGQYNVEEGFLEVDAPILKDDVVQSLDFNAAGRMTSYSTSGLVETWKLGLTSQVNDDIRLRATWSEDIRAPIISELFAPAQYNRGSATDPNTKAGVSVFYTAQGNPNLAPEEATTISGGVVLTPSFIDNLSLSFDWYSITIKGAIFTANNTQILAQCALGVALYCSQLHFGDSAFPADYPGALNFILNVPLNASSETTSGLDFQGDYRMELFSGVLDWHLLGNYNDERTRTALGLTYDGAGALGGDAPYSAPPKLHTTLAASYSEGAWEGTIQGRLIGSARLNNYWQSGVNVDDNAVSSVAYLDLRTSYKWNSNLQLYAAVDNVVNTPPPTLPSSTGGAGPNLTLYDGMGRSFRIGIRANY